LGLETARLLVGKDAQVTVGGRDHDRLDAAVRQLGGQALAVAVDAEQEDSLRQFFAQADRSALTSHLRQPSKSYRERVN
jgi:NADP-dependent 3-hydroxy acid dehydrogenase YdfG